MPYVQRLEQSRETQATDPVADYVFLFKKLLVCGHLGFKEEARTCYAELMGKSFQPPLTARDKAISTLAWLAAEAEWQMGVRPDDAWIAQLDQAVDDLKHADGEDREDQAFVFLPILQYMRAWVDEAALADLLRAFLAHCTVLGDRLKLLAWFFEEAGMDPEKWPDARDEYFHLLRTYYGKDRASRRLVIDSELYSYAMSNRYRHKAYVDKLTRLGNRQAYTEAFQSLCRQEPADGTCFMMMDLDYLKKQNDTYGHEAGDELIQAGADAFRLAMGDDAVLFRYGGDEFIAILTCTEAEARSRTALFRARCDEWTAGPANCWGAVLSGSLGYAFYRECANYSGEVSDRLHALAALADERMYEDKKARKSGRQE